MIKDLLAAIRYALKAFCWEYADRRHMRKTGCPEYLQNDKTSF